MSPASQDAFFLDLVGRRLWRGHHAVPLRPRCFDVLSYLVEHRAQPATHQELLHAVWSGTHVTATVVKQCLGEIRRSLEEDPQKRRFIDTIRGHGYRFIGSIIEAIPGKEYRFNARNETDPTSATESQIQEPPTIPVGRKTELERLELCLQKALQGERQIVMITGEPGIGKTSLVNAFLERAKSGNDLWLGHGQCTEHCSEEEAYRPVLEALGRLCRGPGGERLVELLSEHAPTLLVQMTSLVSSSELEELRRRTTGMTKGRMLRELAEAVEVLTMERPLLLVLEDLHFSDLSTLAWINYLARRQDRARLLVLATYRPMDVDSRKLPLKAIHQDLKSQKRCQTMPLTLLDESAVGEYLVERFEWNGFPAGLAHSIYRRSDGNPLFMVTMVDYLKDEKWIIEVRGEWELRTKLEDLESLIPEDLQDMIEMRLELLSVEERLILETASVVGEKFSTPLVAAGLMEEGVKLERVEDVCDALARRGEFLRSKGVSEWPDGTVGQDDEFVHALYREVLYSRVAATRRARLHLRIGERLEAGYGERSLI